MELANVIGIIANLMFGFKSLPQVIKTYHTKDVSSLSVAMLLLDFGGNIGCTYYIYSTVKYEVVFQFINYGFASLWLIILFVMMFLYRNNNVG